MNSLFLALACAALLAVRMPPVRYGGALEQGQREQDDYCSATLESLESSANQQNYY